MLVPIRMGTNMASPDLSIQISINLDETLLRIAHELKTAETWFLARLFILQSSIISQILEFINWTVTITSFDHMTSWLMKTKNRIDRKEKLRKTGNEWKKFVTTSKKHGVKNVYWTSNWLLFSWSNSVALRNKGNETTCTYKQPNFCRAVAITGTYASHVRLMCKT